MTSAAPEPETAPETAAAAAPASGRWSDLRPRMISAAVMLAVGGLEIWLGGPSFAALVVLLTATMIWELARITGSQSNATRRKTPFVLAVIGAASLAAALFLRDPLAAALLMIPSLAFALTPRRDRRIAAIYAAAIMVAGFGLVDLREESGTSSIVWIVAVVIASDVLGYFAGRILGGPKFWPAISPKKTWSGTIAGWIGAMVVGAAFVLAGTATWILIPLSALVALAGQFGDIAESWIKRRTGVKDSSNLIPGHGGVMDRFDAMIGAVVLVMLLGLIAPLPFVVGG